MNSRKKQLRELKKAKIAIRQALVLFIIFIIGTVLAFNYHYNPSFGNLASAVDHYSRGGKIDAEYELDNSRFIFIKQSKSKKYGFFYEDNNEWKYNQFIKEKKYKLSDTIQASIYHINDVEKSFIKVSSKNEIKGVSDNLGTNFIKMKLENEENVYFGDNIKKISKYYIIYVDNNEYKVTDKKYVSALFQ